MRAGASDGDRLMGQALCPGFGLPGQDFSDLGCDNNMRLMTSTMDNYILSTLTSRDQNSAYRHKTVGQYVNIGCEPSYSSNG